MITEATQQSELPQECDSVMEEIFNRCAENAPNFGVRLECFKESLQKTARKYLLNSSEPVSTQEISDFLRQVQAEDLFLALACANGNERAWWEFDQQHRSYLERVARHLASTDIDAQEVVDTVYVELYGTRVVDGERVSKFSTYSGRGSLRGWLRTVIWHSLVDLHRASHDEVSLDEMTENVGEGFAHASFVESTTLGGEDEMIDQIAKQRYKKATVSAIETAFASLDNHENACQKSIQYLRNFRGLAFLNGRFDRFVRKRQVESDKFSRHVPAERTVDQMTDYRLRFAFA